MSVVSGEVQGQVRIVTALSGARALLTLFLRELLLPKSAARGLVPNEFMVESEQIEALDTGASVDGRTGAGYVFHTGGISQVISGCSEVFDLGCGTSNQLLHLATLHPEVGFVGVDQSQGMLDRARRKVESAGLRNVSFVRADIRRLTCIPDAHCEAVICTMTLLYLRDLREVYACFAEITRILKPGGALYIEDFGRLRSPKSVRMLANWNGPSEEDGFARLYACAMSAAFRYGELRKAGAVYLPGSVRCFRTFPVPFLVVFKTEDRILPGRVQRRLGEMRAALPPRNRVDLDWLRASFRLGGWGNDPFAVRKGESV